MMPQAIEAHRINIGHMPYVDGDDCPELDGLSRSPMKKRRLNYSPLEIVKLLGVWADGIKCYPSTSRHRAD